MPVSRTSTWTVQRPLTPGRGAPVTDSSTSPRSVNFTAFDRRFRTTWRSRPSSPTTSRQVGVDRVGELEAGGGGRRGEHVQGALDAPGERERLMIELDAPGLDLREVEDVVDDRQQGVARGPDGLRVVALLLVQRRVEQEAAHADDGVHRRPDLVAHRREERALGTVGGLRRSARLLRDAEQSRVLDGRPDAARERGQQLHVLLHEAVVDASCSGRHRRRSPHPRRGRATPR